MPEDVVQRGLAQRSVLVQYVEVARVQRCREIAQHPQRLRIRELGPLVVQHLELFGAEILQRGHVSQGSRTTGDLFDLVHPQGVGGIVRAAQEREGILHRIPASQKRVLSELNLLFGRVSAVRWLPISEEIVCGGTLGALQHLIHIGIDGSAASRWRMERALDLLHGLGEELLGSLSLTIERDHVATIEEAHGDSSRRHHLQHVHKLQQTLLDILPAGVSIAADGSHRATVVNLDVDGKALQSDQLVGQADGCLNASEDGRDLLQQIASIHSTSGVKLAHVLRVLNGDHSVERAGRHFSCRDLGDAVGVVHVVGTYHRSCRVGDGGLLRAAILRVQPDTTILNHVFRHRPRRQTRQKTKQEGEEEG